MPVAALLLDLKSASGAATEGGDVDSVSVFSSDGGDVNVNGDVDDCGGGGGTTSVHINSNGAPNTPNI